MERHTTTISRRYQGNDVHDVGEEIASIIAAEYEPGDTIQIDITKVE